MELFKSSSKFSKKQIILLSIPVFFSNMAIPLVGMVDTGLMGNLSETKYLAATSIATSVMTMIVWSFGFLRMGTVGIVAQAYGRSDYREIVKTILRNIALALIAAFIIIIFFPAFKIAISYFFSPSDETEVLIKTYLNVRIFSIPAELIIYVLVGFYLGIQKTKISSFLIIVLSSLNIIFSSLLVLTYDLNVFGVALGTLISSYITLIIFTLFTYNYIIQKFKVIPKFEYLKPLTEQAVPVMFSMLFIGVGIFNILYFIGQFGDLATAGYGAALRVEQVFLLPVIGLNTAVLSIGGQNFGAKAYDRIRELYTKALLFGSSFMAIAGIIIFFGAEFFVSLFTDNQEAVVSGAIYLKVAALIGPIYPVFFITTAVFQAVKKPLYSLYLSILRLTAFPFLSLWYVINIRGGDYKDIFYTIMATNWAMGIVVLIFIGYFLNNVFKQNKPLFSY